MRPFTCFTVSGTSNIFITDAHLVLGWVRTLNAKVQPNITSKSSWKHFGSSSPTYY